MSDLLDLTGAQAAEKVRARRAARGELFDAYRERAAAEELNAFLWVADERPRRPTGPLAGVPLAVKDLFCTEGVPSAAGSRILEGYRPPYTATAVRNLARRGRDAARQDEHGRVRDGLVERELGLRPGEEPVGPRAGARAARAAAAPRPWPPAARRGRSAPTPAARSASRPSLCGIVGLKPTYGAVSRYGMIAFASSLDQAGRSRAT